MKKQVFRRILYISFACIIAAGVLFSFILMSLNQRNIDKTSLSILRTVRMSINDDTNMNAYAKELSLSYADMRVTVIQKNGVVLADSEADASAMENHKDRPEVQEALSLGYSTQSRYSDTLKKNVRYNAMLINDKYIVRLMIPQAAFLEIFRAQASLIILCLLVAVIIALIFANITSKKLMEPVAVLSSKVDLLGNLKDDEPLSEDTYDELLPFVRAVNRQKKEISRKMRQAKEATKEMEWILDSLNYGVVVIDSNNKILYINDLAKDIFASKSPKVLYDITYESLILKNVEKVRERGGKIEFDYRRTKDKKTYCVDMIQNRYLSHEDSIIITLDDITEKSENLKIRQQFFTSASHELKTPVSAVNSLCKTAIEDSGKDKDALNRDLVLIEKESSKLLDVVNNILIITKAQERVIDSKVEKFSLSSVTDEILARFSLRLKEKNIALERTFKAKETLETYKDDFICVMSNLIDNAVKFSRDGGKVTLSSEMEKKVLNISVADEGCGIAKQEQKRIFDRFYRSEADDKMGVSSGSGLGLSIVKNICLKNSWQIEVLSEVDKGSVFTVKIPQ